MIKKIATTVAGAAMLGQLVLPTIAKPDFIEGPWQLTAPNDITFVCGGTNFNHMLNEVTNYPDGSFHGTGVWKNDASYTWDMDGTISGDNIEFTIDYTGSNPNYELNATGLIAANGYIGGDVDGNCQTFFMPDGTAERFEGNHGEYVSQADDKQEAAHSDIGMPEKSRKNKDEGEEPEVLGAEATEAPAEESQNEEHEAMGPSEKATGEIEIQRGDDKSAYAEFNAHEAMGDKEAKGEYHWWALNPDGTLFREVKVEIDEVTVEGNKAWFSGVATYDSFNARNGDSFYVYAQDNGTPGTDGDVIEWSWDSPSYNSKTIIDGNLQVHAN